jgi:hypothetical protein
MFVPQVIEGGGDAKDDQIYDSPEILVTGGASAFIGGQWGCVFGERSKELEGRCWQE